MPDRVAALLSSVPAVRDAALANLQGQQLADGSWRSRFDFYAFPAALYIIMLRTTGLIEHSGSIEEEAGLALHLCSQVNADGGFYKFPGSPSSWSVTMVARLALRLVLGDVAVGNGPAAWFRRNEALTAETEAALMAADQSARRYLAAHPRAWRFFELDHLIFARLLAAHVLCERPASSPFFMPHIWFSSLALRPGLKRMYSSFGRLWRAVLPAIVILFLTACRRTRRGKPGSAPRPLSKSRKKRVAGLVQLIRAQQNENGGWLYNAVFPMLNVMALKAAGVANDDPAILLAHEHLRGRLFAAAQGGLALNVMDSDVWDTAHGLHSLAGASAGTGLDDSSRSALAHLLSAQTSEGGFAWGKGFPKDIENDSTAFALRALVKGARALAGSPCPELRRAIRNGRNFLVSRQNRDGGWSVWEKTMFRGGPGSLSILGQMIMDRSTPDQTARELESLAMSGLTLNDAPVRAALRFFLRCQCRDGSWWSRWWAGYLPGTAAVLMALAALNIGDVSQPSSDNRLLRRLRRAAGAGIIFVRRHQNPDGGWGETILADSDRRFAGKGYSSPLYTALVLSALLHIGLAVNDPAVLRGLEFLLASQADPGQWRDEPVVFCFFSRSFYYTYPFLNLVLPLDTLNDFIAAADYRQEEKLPGKDDSS